MVIDESDVCDRRIRWIAEAIIGSAGFDKGHPRWECRRKKLGGGWQIANGSSIYNGTAGIIYAIAAAYTRVREERYKDVIYAGLNALGETVRDSENISLYTGRLGDVYVLLKLGEQFGMPTYRRRGKELFVSCCERAWSKEPPHFDLLSGASGNIVGLLMCKNLVSGLRRHLRKALVAQCEFLCDTSRPVGEGVAWYSPNIANNPLCGLSHGAAGVALALHHAADYLSSSLLRGLCSLAVLYEEGCLLEANGTWPDYRRLQSDNILVEKLRKNRKNGEEPSEMTHKRMDMWCHGSLGIALARCGMSINNADRMSVKRRQRAIETIPLWDTRQPWIAQDISICHGATGYIIADKIFRRKWGILRDENSTMLEDIWADKFLRNKELILHFLQNGPWDASLFMGYAGLILGSLPIDSSIRWFEFVLPSLTLERDHAN